jgi:hypothetical protein
MKEWIRRDRKVVKVSFVHVETFDITVSYW